MLNKKPLQKKSEPSLFKGGVIKPFKNFESSLYNVHRNIVYVV